MVPAGTSVSPTLTPGITLGNLVFASGQLGVSREAGADTTIQAQTKRALESAKEAAQARSDAELDLQDLAPRKETVPK